MAGHLPLYVTARNRLVVPGGFDPVLPSLVLNLDPSVSASRTVVSNEITQLNDLSGNDYHAYALTTGPQLTTLNGLGAMLFGSLEGLRSATTVPINNSIDGSWHLFVVAQTTSVSGVRNVFDMDSDPIRVAQNIRLNNATTQCIAFSNGSVARTATGPNVSINTTYIFEAWVNGPTWVSMLVNGSNLTDAGTGGSASPYPTYASHYTVGRSQPWGQYWSGPVGQILAYNAVLDAPTAATIRTGLADKWGATL